MITNIIHESRIDLLHMDVQGAEFNVLLGSENALTMQQIKTLVIGTHNNKIHYDCQNFIEKHGYSTILSLDLDSTASGDGILICLSKQFEINGYQ